MSIHPHRLGMIADAVKAGVERYAASAGGVGVMRYKKDATGHEHKDKGPGGGQFTAGGGGNSGGNSGGGGKSQNEGQVAGNASVMAEGHSQRADSAKPGSAEAATLHSTAAASNKTAAAAHLAAHKAGFQAHPDLKGHHATLAFRHDTMAAHHEQLAGKDAATATPANTPTAAKAMANSDPTDDPTTPPPPGKVYNPDPSQGKSARVGVPGDEVPPPPKMIGRLPNLNPEERAIEHKFATMFEQDPDGMAKQARTAMANGMGDGPNIFATDEMKGLFGEWKGSKVTGPDGKSDLSPETKEFRSKYNTSLHQTANAIAKRAFIQHLDEVVAKLPEDQRQVLVTAGGVAAGKGYAIANVGAVNEISKLAAATWDSAGEQNSTELPWIADECKKRGIKMTAVFVHSNPQETWENPARGVIERAGKKGRMVDARVFADSYTHGSRNFDDFHKKYGNDPSVRAVVLDNTQKVPSLLNSVPTSALTMDPEALYGRCLQALEAPNVPAAVKQGGSAGTRIWGGPKTANQPA